MTIVVTRHRPRRTPDVIGRVIPGDDGWRFETSAGRSPRRWYATPEEAEDALRAEVDQAAGERVLAAGFVGLLAAHPLLYAVTALA